MYRITAREVFEIVLMDLAIIGGLAYLFYESVVAFFVLLPMGIPLYKRQVRRRQGKKKNKIRGEFKDVCTAISNNLAAGYSVENAVKKSVEELRELYGDKSGLAAALVTVINKMNVNIPIETAFREFAEETGVKEIIIFSDILSLAKRSGGNMVQIVKNTAESISEKLELSRQVELIFASKKYEQKIMNVIPMAIIAYVKMTSPEMIGIMYTTGTGRVVMSICLVAVGMAVVLSEKIMEIEM